MTDRTAWILGTGSRTLIKGPLVADAMTDAWQRAQDRGFTRLVVVHGAAKGADSLFSNWCRPHAGGPVEEHQFPADWAAPCGPGCKRGHRRTRSIGGDYCPAQGSTRNGRMVDHVREYAVPGSVLVIAAYDKPISFGTDDCVRRAKAAGFPVRRIGVEGPTHRQTDPTDGAS